MRAVRANNDEFERNVRQQDASRLVQAFYAEDAVLMPPDQPAISGQSRIAEFWGGMFQAGVRAAKLETTQLDVSGDLASEIGTYTLKMQAPGTETTEAKGKYVVVLRKQKDGAWKAVTDMFSGNGS
jgi:ketosteroid isomerase-like protein